MAENMEALRKEAKRAYKAKDFVSAGEIYARIIEAEPQPDSAAAGADRTGYATVLVGLNRLDDAAVQFERAVAILTDDGRLHAKFAEVLSRLGRHPEAVRQIEAAIALEPDNADHYYRLAVEMRVLGREGETHAALRRCLELDPDHTNAQILQLELLSLAAPERDGQFDEEEDREDRRNDEEGAGRESEFADGDMPVARSSARGSRWANRPIRPRRVRLRHRPWMIILESVLLAIMALWIRSLFA